MYNPFKKFKEKKEKEQHEHETRVNDLKVTLANALAAIDRVDDAAERWLALDVLQARLSGDEANVLHEGQSQCEVSRLKGSLAMGYTAALAHVMIEPITGTVNLLINLTGATLINTALSSLVMDRTSLGSTHVKKAQDLAGVLDDAVVTIKQRKDLIVQNEIEAVAISPLVHDIADRDPVMKNALLKAFQKVAQRTAVNENLPIVEKDETQKSKNNKSGKGWTL